MNVEKNRDGKIERLGNCFMIGHTACKNEIANISYIKPDLYIDILSIYDDNEDASTKFR